MATDAVTPIVTEVNPVAVEVAAMDEFGRTEAERTVVLLAGDAERMYNEVINGNHDTYQDALNYVIERGFKEIERQRESAHKQELQRVKAKAMDKFNTIVGRSPQLVANHVALIATVKASLTKQEFDAIAPTFQLLGIKL